MDIYDEEFYRNMLLAKGLIAKVSRKKDREICTKWISKLCALRSHDPIVKKNRNHFFKYMLKILHKGVNEKQSGHLGYPQFDDKLGAEGVWAQDKGFTSRWSPDRKTYVAAKPLPGKGALVYMAVSKDPSLGWEHPPRKQK